MAPTKPSKKVELHHFDWQYLGLRILWMIMSAVLIYAMLYVVFFAGLIQLGCKVVQGEPYPLATRVSVTARTLIVEAIEYFVLINESRPTFQDKWPFSDISAK